MGKKHVLQMQRREMKISSLMKKLAEIKMQFSDFQAEVKHKSSLYNVCVM